MSATDLPDAEALVSQLLEQLRPAVGPDTAFVGIRTGGAWLAERLHQELGIGVPLGILDVSFYRDDYDQRGLKPDVRPSEIPFEVEGRDIVLIDDVLYTGRTIRAAVNELFDYGRPARIRLAALVDRGGRELPVAAAFVGAVISLPGQESVNLERDAEGHFRLSVRRH